MKKISTVGPGAAGNPRPASSGGKPSPSESPEGADEGSISQAPGRPGSSGKDRGILTQGSRDDRIAGKVLTQVIHESRPLHRCRAGMPPCVPRNAVISRKAS
ncbi:MAG: hypothetical protein L7F78_12365 [Syntrophales bacterium LBB04]|nr:hypothetical protein [Syntrophales bacterium LBB04]